jgi:lipopolysaccharide/colanic/teichoic acid biosynthesis glycosyltransferase
MNKVLKRSFDVVLSGIMLVVVALPSIFSRRMRSAGGKLTSILRGSLSFVGPSEIEDSTGEIFGKVGVVSIGELFSQPAVTRSQKENYNLYYARNQSLFLDMKILWKAFRNNMTRNTHA